MTSELTLPLSGDCYHSAECLARPQLDAANPAQSTRKIYKREDLEWGGHPGESQLRGAWGRRPVTRVFIQPVPSSGQAGGPGGQAASGCPAKPATGSWRGEAEAAREPAAGASEWLASFSRSTVRPAGPN